MITTYAELAAALTASGWREGNLMRSKVLVAPEASATVLAMPPRRGADHTSYELTVGRDREWYETDDGTRVSLSLTTGNPAHVAVILAALGLVTV